MGTIRIGLLGLVALSAGCAASHPSTTPAPKQDAGTEASASSPVQVQIDNQNYSDMDVYLVNNGMHLLLGSAPGLSKTTLALPKAGSAGGQLQVRLLATVEPLRELVCHLAQQEFHGHIFSCLCVVHESDSIRPSSRRSLRKRSSARP